MSEALTPPTGIPREFKSRFVIVEIILLVVLIAVGSWLWWANRVSAALDYPEQVVVNRLPGLTEPALLVEEQLRVKARKCVAGDRAIELVGVTSWISVSPPGTVIEVGRGAATRRPGCLDLDFFNDVPTLIKARTTELTSVTGSECVKWRLAGVETPLDTHLAPATWTTQEFWLCTKTPAKR